VYPYFTDEHDQLRKVVRDFAEARGRPPRRGVGSRPHVPARRRAGHGRARPVRHPDPRGVRRPAATSPASASPSRSSPGSTSRWRSPSRPVSASAPTDLPFGTEEQERWLPDLCAGRALGGVRADRARCRQRRRRHAHLGHPRRGGREWVIDGEKAFITNSGTPITSFVTITARTGPGGGGTRDQRHRGALRHPRVRGAAAVPQDGLARVGHPRPVVPGTAECQPTTCSASAAEASPSSSTSSTRAASPSAHWPSA
jgi:alkylation response protein AidB-like acyl-CoA dehydrogenase